ncbi:hypothetical protein METSCH_C03390 [Metschnikowia aff. pulcherrima]|uniref:Uncharacterized protein n=1 Tax=Metschnikowia aff. pulcherrima TaxID=2163413 RepID=A0A4P6XLV1_9ASCO|nr:hypothetical protein METSCH_C03390 [Metschnikowia aff. pulcherrima]
MPSVLPEYNSHVKDPTGYERVIYNRYQQGTLTTHVGNNKQVSELLVMLKHDGGLVKRSDDGNDSEKAYSQINEVFSELQRTISRCARIFGWAAFVYGATGATIEALKICNICQARNHDPNTNCPYSIQVLVTNSVISVVGLLFGLDAYGQKRDTVFSLSWKIVFILFVIFLLTRGN